MKVSLETANKFNVLSTVRATVRGTLKFHHSDSVTHAILCNSCNSVQSSTWKVAPSCSTHWSLSMCCILFFIIILFPFLFLCLAIAILLHLHLISHANFNTFCISYSPLISLPWSTAGCYALCSLCSPTSLGESLDPLLALTATPLNILKWALCELYKKFRVGWDEIDGVIMIRYDQEQ